MTVLVVGSGGREHALAWKLSRESHVIAAPGNLGMAEDGVACFPCQTGDAAGLLALCRTEDVGLVVFGPERPLVDGVADFLRAEGVAVYGPGADGARLEGSKAFSKEVMAAAGVPTARFATFTDFAEARTYAHARFDEGRRLAIKASGDALGKGVMMATDPDEADEALRALMVARVFGEAGDVVVVEDALAGPEFSLLTIVGDDGFTSLPVAQDHKRAFDGDQGPNTGGMGTFSPVAWISDELVARTEAEVVAPLLHELKRRGIAYRGTLFSGLMMDGGVPHCLEYNVRFGDPETQSVVLRLGDGLLEALLAAAQGGRPERPVVLDNHAVTVVVASGGYPGAYTRDIPIDFGPVPAGARIFHAGVGPGPVTAGGRVVAASATAPTLVEAHALAYEAARSVHFPGAFFRTDIASGG